MRLLEIVLLLVLFFYSSQPLVTMDFAQINMDL